MRCSNVFELCSNIGKPANRYRAWHEEAKRHYRRLPYSQDGSIPEWEVASGRGEIMRRVIRLKADEKEIRIKVLAISVLPSAWTRDEQTYYQKRLANVLHDALRKRGFACSEIKFEKQ